MSIRKYTNFELIEANLENQGQFLQENDRFIINQSQIENTDFGECRHDVMEVSVYDVNSNLLPIKTGKNVAYIKTGDIKNYLYNITNNAGHRELAIDIEKLLNDLGFTNGILKVNINFVRNKIGSENEFRKVWIHEISPSREEIRILPLKSTDVNISKLTSDEFINVNNLSKDFKYYKEHILNTLDSLHYTYLTSITNLLLNRFGNDFKVVLRKDFGLSDFDGFTERIFLDFKTSIRYWLTNREYDILQSNYGRTSVIRFEDCEAYEFTSLLADMQSILRKCIEKHTPTLKRRDISIKTLPKEFEITQLQKELKDLVGNISINETKVRNVYNPENVDLKVTGVTNTPVRVIPVRVIPIESPEVAPPNVVEILDPPPIEPSVDSNIPLEPSVDSNIPQRGRDTVGRNIIRDVTAGDNELGTGFRPWIVNREIDRENIQ
jgi:hypothetical protein